MITEDNFAEGIKSNNKIFTLKRILAAVGRGSGRRLWLQEHRLPAGKWGEFFLWWRLPNHCVGQGSGELAGTLRFGKVVGWERVHAALPRGEVAVPLDRCVQLRGPTGGEAEGWTYPLSSGRGCQWGTPLFCPKYYQALRRSAAESRGWGHSARSAAGTTWQPGWRVKWLMVFAVDEDRKVHTGRKTLTWGDTQGAFCCTSSQQRWEGG